MDGPVKNVVFGQEALEHIDALYGYALTLTRDTTEAEDLVQETYLRATRATQRPDGHSNLKGWLFVIMRNAWLNQLRHKHNGPLFVDLETSDSESEETGNNPARCLFAKAGTRASAGCDREFA